MLWAALIMGAAAAGELWLLLRCHRDNAKLRVLNELLERANAKLVENARIDAAPMDADDASDAAHDLAKRVRKD